MSEMHPAWRSHGVRPAINEFFSADEAGGSAERRNDAWDALVRARVAVQQAESAR